MSDDRTAADLAAQLRAITADLNGYILRRAAEIADPRIADAERNAAATVTKVHGDLGREVQHYKDLVAELRRHVDALERNYHRALAALNATGVPGYRDGLDVKDEPEAGEPGAQILHWLSLLIPEWPDDQELFAAATCFRGPYKPHRTAVDIECHPNPHSRGMPLGALIRALQAVARYDPNATAADVIIAARNILIRHELPQAAEGARREDIAMADLENRFRT